MAKECRKFGLSLILASQEASDFAPELFAAVDSTLVLRVTDDSARCIARNKVSATDQRALADRMKQLPNYEARVFRQPVWQDEQPYPPGASRGGLMKVRTAVRSWHNDSDRCPPLAMAGEERRVGAEFSRHDESAAFVHEQPGHGVAFFAF